jgi:hypothetical protein
MDLSLAVARFALDKLTSEEALDAASAALDRGTYSESLGQLMFQKPVSSEVGPLFKKAMAELGVPIPSRSEALLVVARAYARQIISGELSPYDGARRIWWEVASESDADQSLKSFVGLASEWEDVPQYRPQYEAEIVQEAHRLLGDRGST